MARHYNVDGLILAECEIPDDEMLSALKSVTGRDYCKPRSESEKVQVLTRFSESSLHAVFDDELGRLTILKLTVGSQDVLLAAVHLHAKVNRTDEEQHAELQNLVRDIAKTEEQHGHRRTILVGDFNMNPFEKGMISSHGLHAVVTRQIARVKSRRVAGSEYQFFYNPMWGLFGNHKPGPAGTHYFCRSTPDMYFWNMFDQVLIRSELLTSFQDDLVIVDSVGTDSFLKQSGLPGASVGSDHLPLCFSVNLAEKA